jgi:hypothetical protein
MAFAMAFPVAAQAMVAMLLRERLVVHQEFGNSFQ